MQTPNASNPLLRETEHITNCNERPSAVRDPSRERVGSFIHQHAIRGAGNVESATVLSPEFRLLLEVVECVICQKLTNHADGMMLFEGSRHLLGVTEAPINKSAEVPGVNSDFTWSTSSSSSPVLFIASPISAPPPIPPSHPPKTTLEETTKQKKT